MTEASPALSFRPVTAESAETFLSFVESYYAFDGMSFDRASVSAGINELLAHPDYGEAWLVRLGDRDVGHFLFTFGFDLEFGGRQATLTEFYLDEKARHRGIGSAILAFIEARLRVHGIHALELQVAAENTSAKAFYLSCGFEAHARIPMSKHLSR